MIPINNTFLFLKFSILSPFKNEKKNSCKTTLKTREALSNQLCHFSLNAFFFLIFGGRWGGKGVLGLFNFRGGIEPRTDHVHAK